MLASLDWSLSVVATENACSPGMPKKPPGMLLAVPPISVPLEETTGLVMTAPPLVNSCARRPRWNEPAWNFE